MAPSAVVSTRRGLSPFHASACSRLSSQSLEEHVPLDGVESQTLRPCTPLAL
jgi:hypothetical protein